MEDLAVIEIINVKLIVSLELSILEFGVSQFVFFIVVFPEAILWVDPASCIVTIVLGIARAGNCLAWERVVKNSSVEPLAVSDV